jgi:hypothetical protein
MRMWKSRSSMGLSNLSYIHFDGRKMGEEGEGGWKFVFRMFHLNPEGFIISHFPFLIIHFELHMSPLYHRVVFIHLFIFLPPSWEWNGKG